MFFLFFYRLYYFQYFFFDNRITWFISVWYIQASDVLFFYIVTFSLSYAVTTQENQLFPISLSFSDVSSTSGQVRTLWLVLSHLPQCRKPDDLTYVIVSFIDFLLNYYRTISFCSIKLCIFSTINTSLVYMYVFLTLRRFIRV